MKVRIYYYHTDCGGVVYYANYLKFLEEARTEYFEKRGIFIKDLMDRGVLFVVARQEIDYKSPAFYGDTLETEAKVTEMGRARLNFEYDLKNQDGKLICSAKTVLVFIDKNFKPKSIPEDVLNKLKARC